MAITPNITEMLLTAHGKGLDTVFDAWIDYTRHHDLFFELGKFREQKHDLWEKIRAAGILGISISEALEKMGLPVPDNNTFFYQEAESPDIDFD